MIRLKHGYCCDPQTERVSPKDPRINIKDLCPEVPRTLAEDQNVKGKWNSVKWKNRASWVVLYILYIYCVFTQF